MLSLPRRFLSATHFCAGAWLEGREVMEEMEMGKGEGREKMRGRVERGEGRKSRGNQIGQKRRKSLLPSRTQGPHTGEQPVE